MHLYMGKLTSNNEQLFNAINLSPFNFGLILSPNSHCTNTVNSQINPGTTDSNKTSKVFTIIIIR